MRFVGLILSVLVVAPALACGGAERRSGPAAFGDADERPVCVVLSSGSAKGIAHLGALRALREHGDFSIRRVSGTSMGALVGSLQATAPTADPIDRYRRLMGVYERNGRSEAANRGLFGALLVGVLTGGVGLALVGGAVAASSTEPIQHQRFVRTMDAFYNGATVESLPIQYAAFHTDLRGQGPRIVTDRSGNLAHVVGMSIANPMLFRDFNPRERGYLDPALDRVTAVPIEATCAAFPDSRIIAINVTGDESFYRQIRCPVLEVRVDVGQVDQAQALAGHGAEFDRLIAAGERATTAILREAGMYRSGRRSRHHRAVGTAFDPRLKPLSRGVSSVGEH